MRILINAVSCSIGGGVQSATALFRFLEKANISHDILFLCSPEVWQAVGDFNGKTNLRAALITSRPGRILAGSRGRSQIRAHQDHFLPHVVYSVFGPAYVRFKCPHLVGFAEPYALGLGRHVLGLFPFWERLLVRIKSALKIECLAREADFVVVETQVARQQLVASGRFDPTRIVVIPNSCADVFGLNTSSPTASSPKRILVMAAPYRHKNLELVPDIALALKRRLPSIHFVFEITIPAQHKLYTRIKRRAMQIGVAESLVSLGVLGPRECVDAYRACNVVLHPSLLEVFSVTYLEAMKMQRPLVVSDLPFAREICGEAALYFDPLSADSAAAQIAMLLESPDRVGSLTAAGERRQSEFPTGESKWRMVLSTLDSINAEAQSRR